MDTAKEGAITGAGAGVLAGTVAVGGIAVAEAITGVAVMATGPVGLAAGLAVGTATAVGTAVGKVSDNRK